MAVRRHLLVLGSMGQMPVAGTAWQVLHYLEGFRRLGWDCTYVEDTGDWPYDLDRNEITNDRGYALRHIARMLEWIGLPGRWAYRARSTNGTVYGPAAGELERLFAGADALVNLTGSTWLRDEHLSVPVRIYLETDPVLRQIEVARGEPDAIAHLSAHTHHFSYGENYGTPDCGVPIEMFTYHPTRPPVVLDWWPAQGAPRRAPFTTVANWRQRGKDVVWQGETYTWSKHIEFQRFLDLPARVGAPLEIALAGDDDAHRLLTAHGWWTVDALRVSRDIEAYRDYIRSSRGEFTVAKDQNIRLRSGWFSDRSVCYLAAGRPVITQDTGFGAIFPTGRGLFAFRTAEDVVSAIEAVERDYATHAAAARELAYEYFAAEKVIGRILQQAGLA